VLARLIALLVVLCTFGLVRVDWAGGTVQQDREQEGRGAIMIVDTESGSGSPEPDSHDG